MATPKKTVTLEPAVRSPYQDPTGAAAFFQALVDDTRRVSLPDGFSSALWTVDPAVPTVLTVTLVPAA